MAKANKAAAHRYDAIVSLITGSVCVRYQKLDYKSLESESGVSESTLRRRIKDPEKFTLSELHAIFSALDIPEDTARSVIPV